MWTLLTLGAPDPPCCDKRFSPGTRGNGSGPRGRIWSSRAPGNRPRRRVSTLTGERGTRAGRRGSPQSEPCGLLRVGGVLGPPGGWTDSPGVDSDDPRPLCLPVSEREPTTKRACDDPQGLGAASVGPGKPECAGGPALHSFKQQAQPANCREGHLPGAGRGGKLSKAPHAGRGPGVRAGSHQQPPAGCQLGVTGEAQNSRGNTETRDIPSSCHAFALAMPASRGLCQNSTLLQTRLPCCQASAPSLSSCPSSPSPLSWCPTAPGVFMVVLFKSSFHKTDRKSVV